MTDDSPPRRRVAVVYHFFAHYRGPVMRELMRSPRYHFLAVADRRCKLRGRGIETWTDCPPERFVESPFVHLFGPFILQAGLIRLALRRDVDDVIYLGNMYWPSTWLSAILARLRGKRVFFWSHGWTGRDRGLKRVLRNCFYRLAHALMLYGSLAKMIAIEEGFDPAKVHVIFNSLDHDAQVQARTRITPASIAACRERLFPGSVRPMVVCTTRLQAFRRLDLLLEAIRILGAKGHPVDLLLVGDGPERENLERIAEQHDLSVHFYGACYDEATLAELIGSANVTVSPGAIGLTAVHSLAYGTPVITHDDPFDHGPEFQAIVPGRTGDTYRRDDVRDLARVLERWTMSRTPDEAIRSTCHEIVDRFFNPRFQRRAIERCLDGEPADDLFWMKDDDRTGSPCAVMRESPEGR